MDQSSVVINKWSVDYKSGSFVVVVVVVVLNFAFIYFVRNVPLCACLFPFVCLNGCGFKNLYIDNVKIHIVTAMNILIISKVVLPVCCNENQTQNEIGIDINIALENLLFN